MTSENPGNATGTLDPVELEYLEWNPEASPVSIQMHPGVADGIARDVIEGFETGSRVGLEVGGLLLGRVDAGARPVVSIERYQRIACEHRFGPRFILDGEETAALERVASEILAAGEVAVVGLYRSHTGPGFQLDEPDFDLIRRYFNDPSDLILLIKQEGGGLAGQFHAWDKGNGAHPVGEDFPFGAHAVTPDVQITEKKQEPAAPAAPQPVPNPIPRRLVPDFVPSPVEPPPSLYGLGQPSLPLLQRPEESTGDRGTPERLKKWLPLLAALLLVGGVLWLLLRPGGHASNPAPARTAEAARPLGLYVDASGETWRVSWNPNATALHEARNVQLFVRDQGLDDQIRPDLTSQNRDLGTYQYRPVGNDVTFRLEVTDKAGQVSAESFRLMRPANPVAATPPAKAAPAAITVQPKPIYRAPPVIAAGVRPRIKGTIPIDVRVQIDARGHVVSAVPVTKQHSGLDQYLASRAVQAARLWRFEPARENGKAVAGTQIIHFTFEK